MMWYRSTRWSAEALRGQKRWCSEIAELLEVRIEALRRSNAAGGGFECSIRRKGFRLLATLALIEMGKMSTMLMLLY